MLFYMAHVSKHVMMHVMHVTTGDCHQEYRIGTAGCINPYRV